MEVCRPRSEEVKAFTWCGSVKTGFLGAGGSAVATYRHPGLGSYPTEAAGGYGDNVFTSMMWLKVVSVYSALRLGVDVLFQVGLL